MLFALQIALGLLALPALFFTAYLLLLTLMSASLPAPTASSRSLKFAVIVPAHNEERNIAETVGSLKQLDWPAEACRLYVVADNCTDKTGERAEHAGAQVLERHDAVLRGKGYALAHAFDRVLADGWADAVVIVDADTVVSPNLLEAYAARLEQGEQAVQAHYGVRNPFASWRTRLVTVAKGAFHIVRSRARERLGVSSGIRGNGWCVTAGLLRHVPFQSFSLTEDIEYGIVLGRSGYRVAYADEAHANADMESSAAIAGKQRQRWESGRFELIRRFALPTLAQAIRERRAVLLDLGLDLLVLPLSYVVINIMLLLIGGIALFILQPGATGFIWIGLGCLLGLLIHVLRGWQVSGTGWRGLTALLHVPGYLAWKVVVMMGRKSAAWVRTEREAP
jgi:cellulose synthase/poly-beta-1,6-N-acetylglucosamine synthase-like glycosyltransferase